MARKEDDLEHLDPDIDFVAGSVSTAGMSTSMTCISAANASSGVPERVSNTNSLTKKGRFRVKRVRTGSADEGRPDSKEQSPVIAGLNYANTGYFNYRPTITNPK